MAINQQIQLKIKGDASQALQQFDRVKKSAIDLGNHLKTKSGLILPNSREMATVAKDMGVLARESGKMAKSYDKAAGSAKNLGKEVGVMGKMMSMGGSGSRNMMFAIGNLGETFSIARNGGYQMRFLLHQLMDSMMMLGPIGLAVGGAVAGLGLLSRNLFATGESMAEVGIATVDLNEVVKKRLGSDFVKATSIVGGLEKQIRDFGKTSLEVKRSLAQESIFNLEAEVDAMQQQAPEMAKVLQDIETQLTEAQAKESEARKNIRTREIQGRTETLGAKELLTAALRTKVLREQTEKMRLQLDLFNSDIKINTIELNKQRGAFIKIDPLMKEYDKRTTSATKASKAKTAATKAETAAEKARLKAIRDASTEISRSESDLQRFGSVLMDEESKQYKMRIEEKGNFLMEMARIGSPAEQELALQELNKLLNEEYRTELNDRLNAEKEKEKESLKLKKESNKLKKQEDKKAKREAIRLAKEEARERKAIIKDVTAVVVGFTVDAAKIAVSSEKNKGLLLQKLFLETTGRQLVALGTRLTIEGSAKLIATKGLEGGGELALGGTAIAAGVAMGAQGAAIGETISSRAEARKEKEREEKKARRSGGARSGSSLGGAVSAEQQSTVVNISYGVGGPAPEQAAQAVMDALAFGNRRGMRGRA